MSKNTKTAISLDGVAKLLEHQKLYTYLMSSLSKTYAVFEGSNATFYFKGGKSLVSIEVPLEIEVDVPQYLTIDMNKFLAASKKIAINDSLQITITNKPQTLRLTSKSSADLITLAIVKLDDDSEIKPLQEFYEKNVEQFQEGTVINVLQDFADFLNITSTYMSLGKNDSIAISNDKVSYNDRTIVLNLLENVIAGTEIDEPILLHKFVLQFIEMIYAKEDISFTVSSDGKKMLWESDSDYNFWGILGIEDCNIALPSDNDLANILPCDTSYAKVTIKPTAMLDSLDFFNGLFEAAVWKPITFTWRYDEGEPTIMLTYTHPTTVVKKELAIDKYEGNLHELSELAEFILISDSIKTLVNKLDEGGDLVLSFNSLVPGEQFGGGVKLQYFSETGVEQYSTVLVKLQDS